MLWFASAARKTGPISFLTISAEFFSGIEVYADEDS
jgi:hypothetical protein